MSTIIGIDLGAFEVKLCVASGRMGRVEAMRFATRRLPPLDEAGQPPPVEARAAVARALLQDLAQRETATVAAALPAEQVSLRVLDMPFTDRGQIDKTIPFELEGHVPFELDEHLLDLRVLGPGPGGGSRLLVALSPREAIARRLAALAAAEIDPRHLVLDADALGVFADRGVQVVLDIGHTRTLIALARDGQVLAARALSLGGLDLTRALASAMKLPFDEAQALKHRSGLGPPVGAVAVQAEWDEGEHTQPGAAPAVHEALRQGLAPLLQSLRASLIAMEDELGLGVEELLLAGGGARLEGLPAHLAEALGVPARRVGLPELAADAGAPVELAVALGMRGAGLTRGVELQFRKEEFAFKGDMAALVNVAGAVALALLLFLLVGTGLFAVRYVQASQELADIDARVAEVVRESLPGASESQLRSPTLARALMVEEATRRAERVALLGAVVGEDPPILGMVHLLSTSMPAPEDAVINVSDLTITATNVSFTADTNSYEAAANIEGALQRVPRLSQAKKSEERQRGGEIQFKINIPLAVAAEEEG